MKYYSLTNTTDVKKILFYPQTDIFYENLGIDNNNNYYKNFVDNGRIKINNNSLATNLLDSSPVLSKGLVIDEKFKELLSEFTLPTHKYYKIPTTYKNKKLTFFWLNFVNSTRHLDFNNSYFKIINSIDYSVIGDLKIKSIDFYNRVNKSLSFEEQTKIFKLSMKDSFPKLDLISFNEINIKNLISEKLKKRLEEENITGIEVSETNLFKK